MGEQSISSLLQDISLGRTVLPEIQREFVWSEQKARDLIDSLYKKFPIGVILLWRPQAITDFRLLEGQENNNRPPDWCILDGQQRLTSLSKIKNGEIKLRFNIDDETFNVESHSIANDPKWLRVDEIWNKGTSTIVKELSKKLDLSLDIVYDKYESKIKKIEEIPNHPIPVFEERTDDYPRIAQIYMRLNEKGTKLKKAEINLALIVLKFPKIFYEKLSELVQEFEEWELDTNFFLRCFVCMSTKQSKYEPLRKYLTDTSEQEVLSNLARVRENLKGSFDFITSSFGINEDNNTKLIPSDIAIIPLMMYLAKTNGKIATSHELDILILWFFAASHFGRYSGPTETLLNEDFRALDKDDTLGTWLNSIKRERNDLNVRELQGRINSTNLFALYFALRRNNAIDWWGGTNLNNTANIEFHHIFPKRVLKKAGYPDNQINDIRNIAIVSRKANRKIRAMRPEEYFASEISDIERVFSQFVPRDQRYWKVENYQEFLVKREKAILNALNQTIKELAQQY